MIYEYKTWYRIKVTIHYITISYKKIYKVILHTYLPLFSSSKILKNKKLVF